MACMLVLGIGARMCVRMDAGPEYGYGYTEIRSEVKLTVTLSLLTES